MARISVRKKDVLWSYVGTFMSLFSNILLLPFIIYFLDGDMLGLWYVFSSIGAIAVLFDFGFGVTFARNITYCWSGAEALKRENVCFSEQKEPNFALMKNILTTCKRIYLMLSGLALLLMLTAGSAYIRHLSAGMTGYMPIVSWIVYAAAVFLNLFYGYYAAFLRGVGAVDQANINTVIARGVQIVATVTLLYAGAGLLGACAGYLLYGTVFRVLGKRRFYRYQGIGSRLAAVPEKADFATMKELFLVVWHNAWRDGLVAISNYLNDQASTLICSMYLSLTATGVYSLGAQIATAVATVASALYMAYQPTLQAAYVTRDEERMRRGMSVIVVVFMGLFLLGVIAVVLVGLPLLKLVKPDAVVSVPVLLGLCLYQFILKFRNCYSSYFSCTNRLPYVKGFIVSSFAGVGLSLLLIGPLGMGIWALIWGQIVSQIVYNAWIWPLKAHREMNLSFSGMFRLAFDRFAQLAAKYKRRASAGA